MLQKIVCTVTYHDSRYKADNISYHTYWNDDVVQNAIFKSMAEPGDEGTIHERWNSRRYDHAMIDEWDIQQKHGDTYIPMSNQSPLPDGMA